MLALEGSWIGVNVNDKKTGDSVKGAVVRVKTPSGITVSRTKHDGFAPIEVTDPVETDAAILVEHAGKEYTDTIKTKTDPGSAFVQVYVTTPEPSSTVPIIFMILGGLAVGAGVYFLIRR